MVPAEIRRGKKTVTIDADEGVFPTTKDGLAKLKPVLEGGTVTFGTQTHPADGNAGMIVTTEERAQSLSRDSSITIQLLGFGSSRAKKGYMGMAVVPAARRALERGAVKIQDVTAIKTHNPFAVNDIYLSKELNVPVEKLNRFGSPLIYGHPQGPTGTRVIIELIEELVLQGGGYGLFSGCAGGDTAMAVVLKVG
jgi:acetyl-CoA acetyltransferase